VSGQRFFTCEQIDDVLVITPLTDIGGVDQDAVQANVAQLIATLTAVEIQHAVFDFQSVTYFGSEMLETMLTVWREVRGRGGRLAVCNLSDAERELLATVRFDSLWPIAATRNEAMSAVRGRG
jgi:anti-anti-sigma factor